MKFKKGDFVRIKKHIFGTSRRNRTLHYEKLLPKWLKDATGKIQNVHYEAKAEDGVVFAVFFLMDINLEVGFISQTKRFVYTDEIIPATKQGIKRFKRLEKFMVGKKVAEEI